MLTFPRTCRFLVSTKPLCVLFPNTDLSEIVGYVYVEDIKVRLKFFGLIGYHGDDSVLCDLVLKDLDAGIQTELLSRVFIKPVLFEHAYIYKTFVKSIKRLMVNGRILGILEDSRKVGGKLDGACES